MSKIELDQTYLTETMLAVATEVFATMMGTAIQLDSPTESSTAESVGYGVISFLGLTGEWTGSGGLCCSADSACRMTSQMLSSEYTEVDDEVRDAVGEITNMIIGNFKNSISAETGPLAMSTPNVVFGRDLTTSSGGTNEWVIFPFSTADYSFRMMLRLKPVANDSRRLQKSPQAMASI